MASANSKDDLSKSPSAEAHPLSGLSSPSAHSTSSQVQSIPSATPSQKPRESGSQSPQANVSRNSPPPILAPPPSSFNPKNDSYHSRSAETPRPLAFGHGLDSAPSQIQSTPSTTPPQLPGGSGSQSPQASGLRKSYLSPHPSLGTSPSPPASRDSDANPAAPLLPDTTTTADRSRTIILCFDGTGNKFGKV